MQQNFLQSGKISDLIKVKKPLFMGVLNVTPDSFSDGGKYFQIEDAIKHAKKLIRDGVDIIDIGGESTRPRTNLISEEEELRRVIPVIKKLQEVIVSLLPLLAMTHKSLISIDTYKSTIARAAIEAGANMINDVSGLTMDPNMVNVAREFNCPIVIMHNRGIPATKPNNVSHQIVTEVYTWLKTQTNFAIKNGVSKENIVVDPGIGFGKSAKEDLFLIENLKYFKPLGFPILVGPSRKSFIKKLFREESLETKSQEMTSLAIKNGADIVRVHKVISS